MTEEPRSPRALRLSAGQIRNALSAVRSNQGRAAVELAVARGWLTDEQARGLDDVRAEALVQRGLITAAQAGDLVRELQLRDATALQASRGVSIPPAVLEAQGDPSRCLRQFVLLEQVGRGGMGVVWRAWDRELQRQVAVKVARGAHGESIQRMMTEARLAAGLSHPGIVNVYAAGRDGETSFIAMAFVDGAPPLARSLSATRAAEIVRDAADAVAHAHDQGVIHRDIKPGNLLVDASSAPRVFVTDFGLARTVSGAPGTTIPGTVLGTPAYMSPEQARGLTDRIDARSDVFSLGATLYELATGQPPYPGETANEVLAAAIRCEPVRPRAVRRALPADLEAIILCAMEPAPARRYASARELADDLQRFIDHTPVRARRLTPLVRGGKWLRRHPALAGMTAALLIGVVVATIITSNLSAAAARANANAADADAAARAAAERAEAERRNAPLRVTAHRDEAVDALYAAINDARARGLDLRRFVLALPGPQVQEYIDALDRLDRFAAQSDAGEVTFVAADCYTRGLLKWRMRDFNGAIDDYTRALDLDPQHHQALQSRGTAWLDKGDTARAIADLTRLLEMQPRSTTALVNRGRAHQVAGRPDDALADFDRALALDPDDINALIARGELHIAQGRFDLATTDIQHAHVLQPGNATVLGDRAALRLRSGDAAGALADIDAALAVHDAVAELHNNRGNANVALGRVEEAIADYTRALELDPRNVMFWINRGEAHVRANHADLAMADYNEALRREPRSFQALLCRGILRRLTGDTAGSIVDCDAAIAVDASDYRAWLHRAIATQTTDTPATIHALQQAVRTCDDPAERERLAGFLRQLGAAVPD